MKTIRSLSQPLAKVLAAMFFFMILIQPRTASAQHSDPKPVKDQRIMLAILLDTSNSMDGLIDLAKSQLWKIVNELAGAKCDDGSRPSIRIALYEYGNDNLSSYNGYVRMVSPLTEDLDLISEKLFALTTNGGSEYCGQVIQTSLQELSWSDSRTDLKMIFIAGNEPFTQGPIDYTTACRLANEKDVVVNTIFCGNFEEGMRTGWKRGADLTAGNYMSIEQDRKTVYVPTPYDDRISELNDKLNDTYIYYGKTGAYKKEQQVTQDQNAERYSKENKVERAVSKSSYLYKNSGWDLVDASKESEKAISEAKDEDLPKEMRGMSVDQRKAYVKSKADQREKIQLEVQELNKKRQQYLASQKPEVSDKSLDGALMKSIKTKAKTKNLSWQ